MKKQISSLGCAHCERRSYEMKNTSYLPESLSESFRLAICSLVRSYKTAYPIYFLTEGKRSSRYTTNAVHVTVLQAFPKTRLSKYTPTYYQRRPANVCLPLMLSPSFRIVCSEDAPDAPDPYARSKDTTAECDSLLDVAR